MAVPAEEKTTERGRLIARLATLLIRYAHPLSVLSCLAGLISLLLLPVLAKNTYISENALIPGSSNARYSNHEIKEANDLAKEILALKQNHVSIQSLLMQHMFETAGDVYFHNFLPPANTFEPSSFFMDSSYSKQKEYNSINSSALGVNVVGIIRAPRGDGKEAIVLVTPFRSDNVDIGDALSLGLGFSLFRMFSKTIWLAKDIIWLAADSKYGAHAAVAAWLKDYHEPEFCYSSAFLKSYSPINSHDPAEKKKLTFEQTDKRAGDFQRAGTIAAGLVFQVKETLVQTDKDRLNVYAEGCNGQMPNLDLINVVNFLAVHRQGLQVRVDSISHMLRWKWLEFLGGILEWLGNVAGTLNPGWKFGLPVFEYVHGAATLASSIYHQALGIPTGAHGAFRDYQVDAITLEMSPQFSLENEITRMSFLLKLGRLLEGVVRSVNNLLEKFHQSFFLYFLTASSRFVSVGVYMIPFALLVVPLLILAASLSSYKHDSVSTLSKSDDKSLSLKQHEPEVTDINALQSAESNNLSSDRDLNLNLCLNLKSQQWFFAAKVVLLVYLWSSVVAMLPFVIYRFAIQASEMKLLIWVVLSCLTLLVGNSILGSPYTRFGMRHDAINQFHMEGWVALKAFTLGATTIGLGIMSIINCAAALLGAIILVPMCLSVYPYKYFLKASNVRKSLLMFLSILFILLAFPPVIMLTLKAPLDDFSKVTIADLWNWTEILWSSQSATYIYLFLVHIPCWVLCSYVLLYK